MANTNRDKIREAYNWNIRSKVKEEIEMIWMGNINIFDKIGKKEDSKNWKKAKV